jgi:peroxiredoxin
MRSVKGLACLALGRYLKNQSERLRVIREDPEESRRWEALSLEEGSTREGLARFLAKDPDALLKEAEAMFERTAGEFGDVPHNHGDTLGDEARSELFEIRNLCAGKPAPEISGEDVDGEPLRLSDFKGKVVVVSFWADWCGECRVIFKDENAIVKRMRGRPFVLLGVNGDGDRDKLKELIKKEGITWRSWRDGGGSANNPGPISRRYNVHAWPTLYVLDHRGVIRLKSLGSPGMKKLNTVIDALVEAAEEELEAPNKEGSG